MRLPGSAAVPPVGYQCPDRTCGSGDTIWLAPLSRPQVGKPWKHIPIGSLVRCGRCGTIYAVTIAGVYEPSFRGAGGLGERLGGGRPQEGERLEDLLGDMRLGPQERGV